MKDEITSSSIVSSIPLFFHTSNSLPTKISEILKDTGPSTWGGFHKTPRTSVKMGVCESSLGRSNIHYEGFSCCKIELRCRAWWVAIVFLLDEKGS